MSRAKNTSLSRISSGKIPVSGTSARNSAQLETSTNNDVLTVLY
jgi:hypothetical protein